MNTKIAYDNPVVDEVTANSGGRSSFYRGVVYTGAGSIASTLFLFLETIIAVRLLDPASYGVFVLLTVVISFLDVSIDFGATTAVTQLIASSDPQRQNMLANSALVFRLVVLLMVSALLWLGHSLFSMIDSSEDFLRYATLVPLMLAAYSLDELLLRTMQGFQAYRHVATGQILRSVLRPLLLLFFLVILGFGMVSLIYSWIISFSVSALYLYIALPIERRFVWRPQLVKEIVRFGFPIQMNQFLVLISSRADVLILGALATPATVAMFTVGSRIPQALARLSDSYTAVYFPTMSALLGQGKSVEAHRMLNNSLRLLSFASALVALMAVLFSHEIVTTLFSETYAASSLVFSLLMLAFHMDVLINVMGYTLTAAGYPGRSLAESGIRTVVNLIANIVLIPIFSLVGPALARLLSYYVSNPVDVWLLRRSNIQVTLGPYVKQTVLLLSCAIFYWWAQPVEYVYRAGILAAFVALNLILMTVSIDDLAYIIPTGATRRFGRLRKTEA